MRPDLTRSFSHSWRRYLVVTAIGPDLTRSISQSLRRHLVVQGPTLLSRLGGPPAILGSMRGPPFSYRPPSASPSPLEGPRPEPSRTGPVFADKGGPSASLRRGSRENAGPGVASERERVSVSGEGGMDPAQPGTSSASPRGTSFDSVVRR